jgi:stearoyl-CoA desaturase (delta-9 desaturase)
LHHPFSDQEADLHSPTGGYFHAFMGWQFKFRSEQAPFMAAKDLLRDRFQVFLHKHYTAIFWTPILLVSCYSLEIAASCFIFPVFLSMHGENIINTFCHSPKIGYRNFATPDQSRNVSLLGWLLFGQGWHNNHHRHPRKYDYGGERWYEFDICSLIVPLLRKNG